MADETLVRTANSSTDGARDSRRGRHWDSMRGGEYVPLPVFSSRMCIHCLFSKVTISYLLSHSEQVHKLWFRSMANLLGSKLHIIERKLLLCTSYPTCFTRQGFDPAAKGTKMPGGQGLLHGGGRAHACCSSYMLAHRHIRIWFTIVVVEESTMCVDKVLHAIDVHIELLEGPTEASQCKGCSCSCVSNLSERAEGTSHCWYPRPHRATQPVENNSIPANSWLRFQMP